MEPSEFVVRLQEKLGIDKVTTEDDQVIIAGNILETPEMLTTLEKSERSDFSNNALYDVRDGNDEYDEDQTPATIPKCMLQAIKDVGRTMGATPDETRQLGQIKLLTGDIDLMFSEQKPGYVLTQAEYPNAQQKAETIRRRFELGEEDVRAIPAKEGAPHGQLALKIEAFLDPASEDKFSGRNAMVLANIINNSLARKR